MALVFEHCWRRWNEWQVPSKIGTATLMVRATDSYGRTQAADRDADHGSYMINHVLPIEIEIFSWSD